MRYTNLPLKRFLAELSSEKPYPGGGSAACLVGSVAIGLSLMVGRIVRKKKKDDVKLPAILRSLAKLQTKATAAIEGDIRTYKKVVDAYSLDKSVPARRQKIEKALKEGYLFQFRFAQTLFEAHTARTYLESVTQGSIASDLVLSRHFLKASFLGAVQTARINLEYVKDESFKHTETQKLEALARQFEEIGSFV